MGAKMENEIKANLIHTLEEKTFPLEIKAIDEKGKFEGYAAIYGKPDLFNESIEVGAFTKTLAEKKQFPVLWYHNPLSPIGLTTAEADSKGLHVDGQLNLEVQTAREKHALLIQKAIKGLSIGFRTLQDRWEKGIRYLIEIKLYEVSLVTFQAHPKALVNSVKSLGIEGELESLKIVEDYLIEVKAGKMISAANFKLINNAISQLVSLLAAAEPPKSTPKAAKKSIFDSVLGTLETKNKPPLHLFGDTIKTLETKKSKEN